MELFEKIFKASSRPIFKWLLFSLFITDWYVNTLRKFYFEFYKTSVNEYFSHKF